MHTFACAYWFQVGPDRKLDSISKWHTPYPFILTGYRACFTYRLSALSIFRMHNETINVWTEFLPALGFAYWITHILEQHPNLSSVDRDVVVGGLIVTGVVRPVCSGLAHLLHCTTAAGYIGWWSCDYVSICLAILSTSIVYGRFSFYCNEALQIVFYTSAIGLISTTLVAVLALSSPGLRAMSFVLFTVFCAGVPFLFQLGIKFTEFGPREGIISDVPNLYLAYWGGSIGCFLLGLFIKSSSLPERVIQRPWNDLVFTSHQLWHICVNVAFALGNFMAWDVYLTWKASQPACKVP